MLCLLPAPAPAPAPKGGDSVLSRDELGSRVDPVLRDWRLEAVYSRIETQDTDDDGLLSLEEVLASGGDGGSASDAAGSAGSAAAAAAALVKYRFMAADVDKNGWLSEKEANYYYNPIWYTQMHGWLAGQCVIALDTDQSASVRPDVVSALKRLKIEDSTATNYFRPPSAYTLHADVRNANVVTHHYDSSL